MHPGHHRRDAGGKKELLGFTDGGGESAQDWRNMLLDCRTEVLAVAARTPVADGALASGRRSASCGPTTRANAGVHKTAQRPHNCRRRSRGQAVHYRRWMAETSGPEPRSTPSPQLRAEIHKAADAWRRIAKPCSHSTISPPNTGKHLRDLEPRSRAFATVRHRTIRSKGCLSNKTALAMVFKLVDAAQKSGQAPMATTSCPSSFKVSGSPTGRSRRQPSLLAIQTAPPDPQAHHKIGDSSGRSCVFSVAESCSDIGSGQGGGAANPSASGYAPLAH